MFRGDLEPHGWKVDGVYFISHVDCLASVCDVGLFTIAKKAAKPPLPEEFRAIESRVR